MKIFSIRRKRSQNEQIQQPKKKGKLYQWYRLAQLRWVRFMEKLTAKMSKKTLMAYLIVFLCFGIGYNVLVLAGYLVIKGVEVDGITPPTFVESPSNAFERHLFELHQKQVDSSQRQVDSENANPDIGNRFPMVPEARRRAFMDSLLNERKMK